MADILFLLQMFCLLFLRSDNAMVYMVLKKKIHVYIKKILPTIIGKL